MSMLSKLAKAALPAALALAVLSGCRETVSPTEPASGRAGASGKFDPPIVITTAKALRNDHKLKDGDTVEDNPISRWARDRLGIIQTNKWIVTDQNDALTTRIKLALSGGEELPDVLFLTDAQIPGLLPDLIASGSIMDIGEAFETYAPARVKEAYAKNPDAWRSVMMDGKRWGMPQISDGKVGDPILWVRQDWLDRLGLKTPTTLDELETVLDAFANGDPDGNGQRDTIALALAGKRFLNDWIGDASFLFGAYGDQPYQWNRMKDGTLAYGSIQPSVKAALARLGEWYAKGYLDPDFGTHDEQKAASLFASGEAGVISGPGWMGGWPLNDASQALPEAVFKPIPYPSGSDGKIGRIGSKLSYGSYFFRKGFAHMDAVFLYWDAVYGSLIEDPESDFLYGYAEGYDYIIKDGEPVFDFPGATSTISKHLLFGPGSAPPNVTPGESIEQRVFQGHIRTPYEKKLASTSSRLFLEGRLVGDIQLAYSQKNEFVGPHTKTMAAKGALLAKLEREAFLKIVYGQAPADSFDEFVQAWRENGGNAIYEEVNRWDRENGRLSRPQ